MLDQILPDNLGIQKSSNLRPSRDLKADPAAYQGKTIMVSGIVLRKVKGEERTEIEVLQIPTGSGATPKKDRARSQGRFLASRVENFSILPWSTPARR